MIDIQYVSPWPAKWKEHRRLPQHQRSLRRIFQCGAADASSWTPSSPTGLRATPPRHTCPYGPLAQADASTDSEAEMSATRTCDGLLQLEFPMTSRVFWTCSRMTCRSHAISPSRVLFAHRSRLYRCFHVHVPATAHFSHSLRLPW